MIDKKYFSWDINLWKIFKEKFKKPIFFKEFVIDKRQIDWASYFWYDALLLIKRVLDKQELIDLVIYTLSKEIYPIIEVDNIDDFEEILILSNSYDFWIAINSRNLETMEIDKNIHFKIFEKYKEKLKKKYLFAFSWINNLEEINNYKWKFNWVLIWSYFMKNIH